MFLSSQQLARSTGAVVDFNNALYAHGMNTMFDAGMAAAEHYADHLRTIFASATVIARQCQGQCQGAGAFGRLMPVVQYPPHIESAQGLPVGMVPACVSDPAQATDSGGATR